MASGLSLPSELLHSPSFQLERLRRRTRELVDQALADQGFTLREYWLLTCLEDRPSASQGEIGELLTIDPSDMVRLVDSLEQRSYARRDKDPRDRRRQIISITKKGRKIRAHLHTVVAAAEDAALDESTSKQLKQLRKLARVIIAAEEDNRVPTDDAPPGDTTTDSAAATA